MKIHEFLIEERQILVQEKLPYAKTELAPVMSRDTLDYHYGKLASGYVKRYNAGEGDEKFNQAGAFLHNIFFLQLKTPAGSNKPTGTVKEIIHSKYNDYETFKSEFFKAAMSIQGSGWIYLSKSGDIKIIKNHAMRSDILLLVDWWEHAWALDYQADKGKYLNNMWRIINWEIINARLT